MELKSVEIVEAKEQFSEIIDLALNGEDVIFTKEGQPLLRLSPVRGTDTHPEDVESQVHEDLPAISADKEDMIDLLEAFLEESLDALITIDIELQKLQKNPYDRQQLDLIYSIFHRIKYNCNIIHAHKLKRIATAAEALIEQMQLHQRSVKHLPVDLLQQAADAFITVVRNLLRDRNEGRTDFTTLINLLYRKAQQLGK